MKFYPESTKNPLAPLSMPEIISAMQQSDIIESRALICDSEKNLHFKLGAIEATIPYSEFAPQIESGDIRDIAVLSRVGMRTCFVVDKIVNDTVILSRKKAQQICMENYINKLLPGDIIFARITHIENFGAFCDIGCGIIALLPIDCMSVSRINTPKDRFTQGQQIYCVVKSRDEKNRIVLSTKELFGTWLENAKQFTEGQTVLGVVRSIESYGVFVELAPNLAGLAETCQDVECGQTVSVFIKSIQPEKMKIKLAILNTVDCKIPVYKNFTKTSGHIDIWEYSTPNCFKNIKSIFD